jgi:hypothetical protein
MKFNVSDSLFIQLYKKQPNERQKNITENKFGTKRKLER